MICEVSATYPKVVVEGVWVVLVDLLYELHHSDQQVGNISILQHCLSIVHHHLQVQG